MTPSDREKLEKEADRLLSSPAAQRKRARIESADFTEEDGRAMWENIPGRPGERWQKAIDLTARSMRDLGETAGLELGFWAGRDKVKQFAAYAARGCTAESVGRFARRMKVSETYVHKLIRQAKKLVSSFAR